jgi:hypothetical protein
MKASSIFHHKVSASQPLRCRAGQLALTAGTVNKRQLVKIERAHVTGEIVDGLAYRNDVGAGPAWIVTSLGDPLQLLNPDGTLGGHAHVTVFLDSALVPLGGDPVGCWPRRHLSTGEACHG